MVKKELKHITGHDVIKFIEHNLGQKLPKEGLLAGQSVTSVILYIMGKNSVLNINDYDIFFFRNSMGDSGKRLLNKTDSDVVSFIDTNYIPKLKKENITNNSVSEIVESIQEEKRRLLSLIDPCCEYIDPTISEHELIKYLLSFTERGQEIESKHVKKKSSYILSDFNFSLSGNENRSKKLTDNVRKILRQKGILGNAKASLTANYINKDTYQILSVKNEDLINKIVVYFNNHYNTNPYHGETITSGERNNLMTLNYYKQYSIISNFDINANQVGVDLETGQILYTPHFFDFTKGQQLKIVNLQRCWHALARYFDKKETHGYFGNNECEIDKVMTYYSLKNSINLHESFIQDGFIMPNFGSLFHEVWKDPLSPLMGEKYIDLCRKNGLFDYLEINNTFKAKDKSGTELYELAPKSHWTSNVTQGKHKEKIEKTLGKELVGYQIFALSNINNIMSSEYNLMSEKKLNTVISYSKELSKVEKNDSKLPIIRKKELLEERKDRIGLYNSKILDKLLLKGHYEIGNISRISKFIETHPESIELFNNTSTDRWIDIISKFRKLEELSYRVFGYWISNHKSISPIDFLDKSIEELETIAYENSGNSLKPLRDVIFNDFEFNGIEFKEIVTSFELNDLGHKMRHCIGGYDSSVASWDSCILLLKDVGDCYMSVAEVMIPESLRKAVNKTKSNGETYNIAEHKFSIGQHKIKLNRKPKEKHRKALIDFINNYNREVEISRGF